MLKHLWVMRHGLAKDNYECDFNRGLSLVGERQAKAVAEQLVFDFKKTGTALPQSMLVSPFRRTQETAKVVHKILNLSQDFEIEEMLVHSGDAKILGDYLLASHFESLILISHMPIVADLCRYLLGSINVSGFQTAQVVKLAFDSDQKASLEKNYIV